MMKRTRFEVLAFLTVMAAGCTPDPGEKMESPDSGVSIVGEPGLSVSTRRLQTDERGNSSDFLIVLHAQPDADVVVALTSSDPSEGTVSSSRLTFTPQNFDVPRTVFVTGVDDDVLDGPQDYTIDITIVSDDAGYDGFDAGTVDVVNVDDETASLVATPSASVLFEGGAGITVDVSIGAKPLGDLNVAIAHDEQVQTSVDSLLFDSTTTRGSFMVTAVDDTSVEPALRQTELTVSLVSPEAGYAAVSPVTLLLDVVDDDSATVTAMPPALTLLEGESESVTFTMEPASDAVVSVDLNTPAAAWLSVSPISLQFQPGEETATVTITAYDDSIAGAHTTATLTGTTSSVNERYDGIEVQGVSVTVLDSDDASLTVTPTSVTVSEGGDDTFHVSLGSEPQSPVTVNFSSPAPSIEVDPTSVTWSGPDWQTAKTVTVTSLDDDVANVSAPIVVGTSVVTSDPAYANMNPDDVVVTVEDDELASLAKLHTLTVSELGTSATLDVTLTSTPIADVVVHITSGDPSEVTVSPATLTFPANTPPTAKSVTVTGVDDNRCDDNTVTSLSFVVTSADAAYSGLVVPPTRVTVLDNDSCGVTFSSTTLTVFEGTSKQIALSLTGEPLSPVTIDVESTDLTQVTVAPAQLVFDATNYLAAQNVTVTAIDDAWCDGNVTASIEFTISSADPAFDILRLIKPLIFALDNEGCTISTTTGAIRTTEDGGTVTFTLALTGEPRFPVTIPVVSDDPSEGIVTNPASGEVVLDATNWQLGVQIEVTGQDDGLVDGDVDYDIDIGPVSSLDPAYDKQGANPVHLVNEDDD